jgi:tetratricopeptide (TPR) repeat protein
MIADASAATDPTRSAQLLAAVDQVEGNYGGAREHLQKALASGGLNDEEALTARFQKGRLESDVESYEFLASCWIAAREYEKGIEPLRRAADLSDNGELYVRLAEVHVQREEWQDAAEAMRLALTKGKIKDLGRAQLLMGFVSLKQNKLSDARSLFQQASADKALHAQAEAWLKHVDSKLVPQS